MTPVRNITLIACAALALCTIAQAQVRDAAVFAAAQAAQPAVIETLQQLVKIESGSGNLDGLSKVADFAETRLKALDMGAGEFLSKPVDRMELTIRVKNLLRLKEYADFLADRNLRLENQVAARTAQLTDSYHETIFMAEDVELILSRVNK